MSFSAALYRLRFLFLTSLLLSFALSFWLDYREVAINPDGICYVMSAELLQTTSLANITHYCPQAQWPFYPALIYGLVKALPITYVTAAYVLNAVFTLLSIFAFIFIVKEMGGNRRVLWLAAAVILLSHMFNSVREYIIRDHGFWASYLCSVYFVIRFFHYHRYRDALLFSLSACIASLFRIEGVIFLALVPLLNLLHFRLNLLARLRGFLALNFMPIVGCILALVWVISHPHFSMEKIGRLAEITHHLQHGMQILAERYVATKAGLIQYILPQEARRDAGSILLVMMSGWYLVSIMTTLSWIYSLLVIYAWRVRAAFLTQETKLVLFGYLSINFLITFAFLFERFFLSKRYLIAMCLILMLWVPFALNDLWQKYSSKRYRALLAASMIGIILSAVGGIFEFGYSKAYIPEAGQWMSKNLPLNAKIFARDDQLMYYSHRYGSHLFADLNHNFHLDIFNQEHLKKYDYLALRINAKSAVAMKQKLKQLPLLPIKEFSNKRGDKVAIYKVKENAGEH